MAYQFKCITASGTFDRFHKGHKVFLKRAFKISDKVLIGITSDEFVNKKRHSHLIEPFKKREDHVSQFLRENGLHKRAEIFRLNDLYGPTLEEATPVQGVLVTEKTEEGAKEINRKRRERSLPPLAIIKVPLIKTEGGDIICSTSLRQNLILPEHLRPVLKKPLGTLLKGNEQDLNIAVKATKDIIIAKNPSLVITVGDVVTQSFNQAGILIDLAIVDFKVKREESIHNLSELGFMKREPNMTIENAPGTISQFLSEAIEKAIKLCSHYNHETIIVRVFGEEDLAVLPAIIHAPEKTLIFYGQPREGIVMVKVKNTVKTETEQLLSRFTTQSGLFFL